MAQNPPTFFGEALDAIDAAGSALKAKLDELWVPFDPETATGGLHWHGTASLQIMEALKALVSLEQAVKAIDWPTPAADTAPAVEAPAEPEPETPAKEAAEPAEEPAAPVEEPAPEAPTEVPATPAAVAHAEATGVDLTQVEGTGVGGTVTKPDVVAAAAEVATPPAEEPAATTPESEPTPDNPSA